MRWMSQSKILLISCDATLVRHFLLDIFSPWILWFPFLRTDAVDILSPLSEISNEWSTPPLRSDCLLVERGGKLDSFLCVHSFSLLQKLGGCIWEGFLLPKDTSPKQGMHFLIPTSSSPWCGFLELLMSVKVKLNTGILVLFQLIMFLRAPEP